MVSIEFFMRVCTTGLISFDISLPVCSLNQDCAEYNDARVFFTSPAEPDAEKIRAVGQLFRLAKTFPFRVSRPAPRHPSAG
jgi:hypothetical protein